MSSIWNPIKPKKSGPKPTGYAGNAEQLLNYSLTHTSPRALRALRVEVEIRRAIKERALPTVAEIQARHNFTEEAAKSFLQSLQRAMKRKSPPKSNVKNPQTLRLSSVPQPQSASLPSTSIEVSARDEELKAILHNIRSRYGDEIRIHGEQTTVREGFVYLVTNPCFGGWVKAGMTIDYELRMGTYNVSDPLSRFELSAVKWVIDRRLAEKRLLEAFNALAKEVRGEWARIDMESALVAFESI